MANSQIELRRGAAAQWTAANPILAAGEPGFETDTSKLKIGDGSSTWNALPYHFASLTGNTADDATILSGGTGQKLPLTSFGSSGVDLLLGLPDVPENYYAASGLTGPSQVGDGHKLTDASMTVGLNQLSSATTFTSADIGKRVVIVPPVAGTYAAGAGADALTATGQTVPGTLYAYIGGVAGGKALITQDAGGTTPLNASHTCTGQIVYYGHDCTAALNACHAANNATEGGGGVGQPGGGAIRYRAAIYCISGQVLVTNGSAIQGAGKRSSLFACMTPTAGIMHIGRGTTSRDFTVYGNWIATMPFALGYPDGSDASAHRRFQGIEVKYTGAGSGTYWRTQNWSSAWYMGNCQNCIFSDIDLAYSYGAGAVGDWQCGGNGVDGVFEIESISGHFFQGLQSTQTQTITVTNATGGSFTLTFAYKGQTYTTAAIAYNATAATIATAMATATGSALSVGQFTSTTGGNGSPAVLKWLSGPLGGVSTNGASLTGSGPTVTWTQSTPGWVSAGNNDFRGMQLERGGGAFSDGNSSGAIYVGSGAYSFGGKFLSVNSNGVQGRGGITDANYPNPNPNFAGSPTMISVLVEKNSNATNALASFSDMTINGSGASVGEIGVSVGDGAVLIFEDGVGLNAWQSAIQYSQGATLLGLAKLKLNGCGTSWVNGTGTTSTTTPNLITAATQPFQVGDQISGGTLPGSTIVTAITGTVGNWTLTISGTGATGSATGVALTRGTGSGITFNSVAGLAVANMAQDSPAVPPRLASVTADLPALVDIGEIAPGGVVMTNTAISTLVNTAFSFYGSGHSNRYSPMVTCTFAGKAAIGFYRQGTWAFTYSPLIQAQGLPQNAPAGAITQTYDRDGGSAILGLLTSGTLMLSLAKYAVGAGVTVNTCNFATASTAAVSPTHSWLCIVDPATLNILAVTGDNLTHAITGDAGGSAVAGTAIALTTPWTPAATIAPYIGLCVSAGTMPTLEGASMRNGTQSVVPVLTGNSTVSATPLTVGTTVSAPVAAVGGHAYMWLS